MTKSKKCEYSWI